MMESGMREAVEKLTIKGDSESVGLTPTLSRWSSEPASLSSGGDETSGVDLLERTRRSIATLQYSLAAERDHCRQLQAQLDSMKGQTAMTPTTFDAILRCIEQERSENRQLHSTVLRQHKTIVKLRRQLRSLRLRPTAEGSSISSDDFDDRDDSLFDFEMVSVHPLCCSCNADHNRPTVIRRHSDTTVPARSSASYHCHRRLSDVEAAKCPVIAAMDDQRQANGDGRATIDPAEKSDDDRTGTLRRRLRDTVEMCQRLATALDARHDSSTTHDVSQILSTNHSACTAQLIACSVDKQVTQDAVDAEKTTCSSADIPITHTTQPSAVETRLKEVEEMNARWQGYMEQREKYTHALEQRCSDLEQKLSQHHHYQPHQLTDEQQRWVDQILLEQRQKTELAEETRLQTEADNKQLRAQLAQLKTTQAQNKVCINQLLSRLHEVETVRRSEQSTIEVLQQQVNTYREDFEGEQLDRHRAQERVVNLERQVATLKNRLSAYESSGILSSTQRLRWWQDTVSEGDSSLPLLVARGETSSFPATPSSSQWSIPDSAPRSY